MAITLEGTRTSSNLTVTYDFDIETLPIIETDSTTNELLLPVAIKDFRATDYSATNVNLTAASNTFVVSEGDLAKIKVGDIINSLSSATNVSVPAPATYTRDCHTFNGLNFIKVTGVSALPKTGETVTGTGIPSSTVVKRVDTVNRYVYLNNNCTESTVAATPVTLTFQPLARVTGINTTTRTITISHNFAGSGSDIGATVNFIAPTFKPVLYYLGIGHSRNGDNLNVSLVTYSQTGLSAVEDSGKGTDGTSKSTVVGSQVGAFFINTDTYLTNARKARTAS